MEIFDVRETGKPQTGRERAYRQDDGSDQGALAQAKDRQANGHNFSM